MARAHNWFLAARETAEPEYEAVFTSWKQAMKGFLRSSPLEDLSRGIERFVLSFCVEYNLQRSS